MKFLWSQDSCMVKSSDGFENGAFPCSAARGWWFYVSSFGNSSSSQLHWYYQTNCLV